MSLPDNTRTVTYSFGYVIVVSDFELRQERHPPAWFDLLCCYVNVCVHMTEDIEREPDCIQSGIKGQS